MGIGDGADEQAGSVDFANGALVLTLPGVEPNLPLDPVDRGATAIE